MDDLTGIIALLSIFIGMPWVILSYRLKSKQVKSITIEDENLLDELYEISRKLDARLNSIERIISADKELANSPPSALPDQRQSAPNVELRIANINKEL